MLQSMCFNSCLWQKWSDMLWGCQAHQTWAIQVHEEALQMPMQCTQLWHICLGNYGVKQAEWSCHIGIRTAPLTVFWVSGGWSGGSIICFTIPLPPLWKRTKTVYLEPMKWVIVARSWQECKVITEARHFCPSSCIALLHLLIYLLGSYLDPAHLQWHCSLFLSVKDTGHWPLLLLIKHHCTDQVSILCLLF